MTGRRAKAKVNVNERYFSGNTSTPLPTAGTVVARLAERQIQVQAAQVRGITYKCHFFLSYMDFTARRSHVLRVMIVVYAVFGFALIYFLFFNTGLQLHASPGSNGNSVVLANDSVHAIRDITVVYLKDGQREALQNVELLLPGESKMLELNPSMVNGIGYIELQVMAPFHLTTRALVPVGDPTTDGGQITFQFSYPSAGYVGKVVEAIVTGCNTSDAPQQLQVAMELPAHAEWSPSPLDWSIPANDCASTLVSFVPDAPEENLLIKIRVLTAWRVLGEGSHSVAIISLPDSNNTVPPAGV